CRLIEPGVCPTSRRFEVLCECKKLGIPTVVWFSPLLPFINDTKENVDRILDYCIRAGVKAILCFGIGLTLREGNREYFYAALDRLASQHRQFANMKERYIRTYGNSYMVASPHERELMQHLSALCRKNNIMLGGESVFKWIEDFPEDSLQPGLF
ncbi:MAG: radical SAM protein, partial [Treponema sp.]|nr:radical SAM protein [Treponema sp.]